FDRKVQKANAVYFVRFRPPLLIIKSLDASGRSVFRIMIRPAMLDLIRAAASTQTLGRKNDEIHMSRNLSEQLNPMVPLLFILALLTGCGTSPPIEPTSAARPADSALTRQDRIDIFEDI